MILLTALIITNYLITFRLVSLTNEVTYIEYSGFFVKKCKQRFFCETLINYRVLPLNSFFTLLLRLQELYNLKISKRFNVDNGRLPLTCHLPSAILGVAPVNLAVTSVPSDGRNEYVS